MNRLPRLLPALGLVATLVAQGGAALASGANEVAKPATDLVDFVRPTSIGEFCDRWRIRPYGWVETSLTTSPLTESDTRAARVFDAEAEGFRFHQAYFAVERVPVECGGLNGGAVDLGGKVAVLWGTDAALVHARGLCDDQEGVEQFDLLEVNAQLRFPVAQGLTFKLGKCTTPMGFEVIEAANDLLPSRSFLFGYAIPFTHTGAIATLQASAQTSVSYGVVLGWDVWDDNNDALTQLASFAWKSPSEADTVTVNAIVGAERAGNDDDLRTVVDATWVHTWSESWKTALNADVGFEQGAAAGKDATWWGAAGYATRTFSDAIAATARAEYFRDVDGTRLSTPASLAELTIGLDWKPWTCLPNLHLRPEVRWDHSFDGPFFDEGRDEDQLSLTLDLIFTF